MMSAHECAAKAQTMEAKALACLDPAALALYRQLALEWWALRDDAIRQDDMQHSVESLDARTSWDLIDFDHLVIERA
jgi:hypothetical protein